MADNIVHDLFSALQSCGAMIAVAESCTGGQLAARITAQSGASAIFERGYVTYTNQAKQDCLGVPSAMLDKHGAVSLEVAEAMAQGAAQNSNAQIAVSTTGIAGPDGGTTEKPVGLVCFGFAIKNGDSGAVKHLFTGERSAIQKQAVDFAIKLASQTLHEKVINAS